MLAWASFIGRQLANRVHGPWKLLQKVLHSLQAREKAAAEREGAGMNICKHHRQRYQCSECPPLPLAAEIMQELIRASEKIESVRGCSSKCNETCYCGARDEKEKAEGRMSWAVVSARDWCATFKQKKIKSDNHNF